MVRFLSTVVYVQTNLEENNGTNIGKSFKINCQVKLTSLVVRQKVVMDQAGPQMESIDIADNRLSGCERTTTTALHVGQTYIC